MSHSPPTRDKPKRTKSTEDGGGGGKSPIRSTTERGSSRQQQSRNRSPKRTVSSHVPGRTAPPPVVSSGRAHSRLTQIASADGDYNKRGGGDESVVSGGESISSASTRDRPSRSRSKNAHSPLRRTATDGGMGSRSSGGALAARLNRSTNTMGSSVTDSTSRADAPSVGSRSRNTRLNKSHTGGSMDDSRSGARRSKNERLNKSHTHGSTEHHHEKESPVAKAISNILARDDLNISDDRSVASSATDDIDSTNRLAQSKSQDSAESKKSHKSSRSKDKSPKRTTTSSGRDRSESRSRCGNSSKSQMDSSAARDRDRSRSRSNSRSVSRSRKEKAAAVVSSSLLGGGDAMDGSGQEGDDMESLFDPPNNGTPTDERRARRARSGEDLDKVGNATSSSGSRGALRRTRTADDMERSSRMKDTSGTSRARMKDNSATSRGRMKDTSATSRSTRRSGSATPRHRTRSSSRERKRDASLPATSRGRSRQDSNSPHHRSRHSESVGPQSRSRSPSTKKKGPIRGRHRRTQSVDANKRTKIPMDDISDRMFASILPPKEELPEPTMGIPSRSKSSDQPLPNISGFSGGEVSNWNVPSKKKESQPSDAGGEGKKKVSKARRLTQAVWNFKIKEAKSRPKSKS